MEEVMTKLTHQPRLEVFPQKHAVPRDEPLEMQDDPNAYEEKFHVRLVAGNGIKLMVSPGYDNESNGVRAAHTINRITSGTSEYPNGRLRIEILNEDETVRRIIEPEHVAEVHTPALEDLKEDLETPGYSAGIVELGYEGDG
jgi:uncharacterized protein YegP (UPF0339 family)